MFHPRYAIPPGGAEWIRRGCHAAIDGHRWGQMPGIWRGREGELVLNDHDSWEGACHVAARVTKKVDAAPVAAAAEEEECAVKRQSWIAAAMFAAACLTRSVVCLLAWLMWRNWKSIYSHRRHLADSSIRENQPPFALFSMKTRTCSP